MISNESKESKDAELLDNVREIMNKHGFQCRDMADEIIEAVRLYDKKCREEREGYTDSQLVKEIRDIRFQVGGKYMKTDDVYNVINKRRS